MKISIFLLCITQLFMACSPSAEMSQDALRVTRQIAEFESLEAIWLIWPYTDHKRGESVQEVKLSIIDTLINDIKVNVTCTDEEYYKIAQSLLNERYKSAKNLTVQLIPSYDIWARDMGPIFVETNQGQAIADFNFNAWGYSDTLDIDTKLDEMYDVSVAEFLNLPVISSPMISEGCNRELNGKGTLITSEVVERGRNPNMSKSEMELEYKRLLGVKKTIWLNQGLVEDDHTFLGPIETSEDINAYTLVTTNGHVDEFARFVNDSTILLAIVDSVDLSDPIEVENHRRMEENYQILSKSMDQDGKPFTILRMPVPETILTSMSPGDYVYDYIKTLDYTDGSSFPDGDTITVIVPTSYLNF